MNAFIYFEPFLNPGIVLSLICLGLPCLILAFFAYECWAVQRELNRRAGPPAWYLDAMREGCCSVCWEAATRWQVVMARIRYWFRP